MEPTNVKEFQELVHRYETITLKEIEKAAKDYGFSFYDNPIQTYLTGYGYMSTCTLCKKSYDRKGGSCKRCIYTGSSQEDTRCMKGRNRSTFKAIEHANSVEELLEAYRNRAKHLRKYYARFL